MSILAPYKYFILIATLLQIAYVVYAAPDLQFEGWYHGFGTCILTAAIFFILWYVLTRYCDFRNYPVFGAKRYSIIILIIFLCSAVDVRSRYLLMPNILTALYAAGIFFLLCSVSRRLTLLTSGIFMSIQFLQAEMVRTMDTVFSFTTIMQICHATEQEVNAYLTMENITKFAIAIMVCVFLSYICYRQSKNISRIRLAAASCFSLALWALLNMSTPLYWIDHHETSLYSRPLGNPWSLHSLWPIGEIVKISGVNSVQNAMLDALSTPKEVERTTIPTIAQDDKVIVILHIGESVLSQHLGFNGYYRNTTNWLSHQKNLINFKHCISSYFLTDQAVPVILTDATEVFADEENTQNRPKVNSISDFFSANNFIVSYCFGCKSIGLNKPYSHRSTYGKAVSLLSRKANYVLESDSEDIMSQLSQIEKIHKQHKESNQFFVVNNFGSHAPYNVYDKAHPAFLPCDTNALTSDGADKKSLIINAYDNTIVYTDSYIEKLLKVFEGKPYVYFFISDHGDFLGDDPPGRYGRGWLCSNDTLSFKDRARQYQQYSASVVPFFVLASPEFKALHPHFPTALQQLKLNSDMTIGHGHIFHTILGLFDIKWSLYKESLDLTSDLAEPYQGTKPEWDILKRAM